jgi:hypothetical protein
MEVPSASADGCPSARRNALAQLIARVLAPSRAAWRRSEAW